MNKSIAFSTVWAVRKSTFFWALALFGITLMTIGLFDSMAAQYATVFEDAGVPEGFEAFVGEVNSFSSPEGWLSVEVFSMVLPLSLAIIGIGAGAGVIGREENSGTLELLLASPLGRNRIVLEKAIAIALQLTLVSLAAYAAIVLGTLVFPFDVSLGTTFEGIVSGWLLGLFFAYVAFAIQLITGNRGLALGVGSGLLIIMYFASTLAPMVETIEGVKYASAFYYYNGQNILTSGLEWQKVGVLLGSIAALLAASFAGFRRRDTGV